MKHTTKIRIQAGLVLVIAIFGFLFAWPKGPNWIRDEVKLHLGLDLAGGAHLVYEADVSQIPEDQRESAVEGTRDVIERRVNAFGVGEPVVQTNKTETGYRIIVELPGVTDITDAIGRIGDTPVLEFKEAAEAVPLTEEERAEREKVNEEQKVRAEEVLADLKNELINGVAQDFDNYFGDKARSISEDQLTKEKRGDFGFLRKGAMPENFQDILFDALEDGQMHDELIETVFGYHIISRLESQCFDTQNNTVVLCPPHIDDQDSENSEVVREVRGRHILFQKLDFGPKTAADPWKNTKLSGEHLKRASMVFDSQSGLPVVNIEFNSEGSKLFEEITERNVGRPVAIFLDGELISAPNVQQKISGGSATISGNFTIAEAQDLTRRLNAGALPVDIELVSQQQIGASLGKESVQRSFLAGILGMLLVIVFMILYYRLPGIVASVALIIYGLIMISIFKLIPVTLTLSGIAGFILSIGLAVDANVLIFERIKEELRNKKTLQAAIDEGFSRAWTSIKDSNISTLITAFILVWLGESLVKGFGITLGIGVILSMISAITITRVLLKLVARSGKEGNWMWGV